jgi:hypothetical protein
MRRLNASDLLRKVLVYQKIKKLQKIRERLPSHLRESIDKRIYREKQSVMPSKEQIEFIKNYFKKNSSCKKIISQS